MMMGVPPCRRMRRTRLDKREMVMPVLDKGVARGDFEAYIGADNTFGVNWQEWNGTEWVPKNLAGWGGRFEIWSLDKSTLLYAQQGRNGENGFEVNASGRVQVTVPREVFEKDEWLQRGTVMYKLYAIPPKYTLNSLFVTRDDVYENFCTLQECHDNMDALNKRIDGLQNDLDAFKIVVKKWIQALVDKVYAGGTVNDGGTVTWPNDAKIAIGNLNVYSNGAEGDTFDNALRTRAANTTGDTRAV